MKPGIIHLLAAVALLGCAYSAQAAISCTNPVSTGFSTAYASAGVVPNVTQGTVSFTCTRDAVGDPTALLLRADNGANATGNTNRAALAGNFISYEAYSDSACTLPVAGQGWTRPNNANAIAFNLTSVLTAQPVNLSFWGCITVAPVVPAGTYTDMVSMDVRIAPNNILSSGTFPVSITYPAECNITTAPGNVTFTYTAFGSAVNASTSFGATCTSQLPYTMSLDAYVGVVAGLQYSLAINSSPPPVSSRGTGVAQTHTINGSMPAGQAGTCATGICSATNVHTLTITY